MDRQAGGRTKDNFLKVRIPEFDFSGARSRVAVLAWQTPVVPLGTRGVQLDRDVRAYEGQRRDGAGAVVLKLESLQNTGSFKVRGAANRLAKLSAAERGRGVVAVSSGNHGKAVAEVSRQMGVSATVCVPEWTDPSKLQAIRASGARVVCAGPAYDDAEEEAASLAAAGERTLVHPFDDPDIIEGQGTIGLEVMEQFPCVEEVIVPLSGGGLVAGVGLAVREHGIRVVAVSAERASVMHHSIAEGHPVEVPDRATVASALSGGIGLQNRYTFEIVEDVVAEHVVVCEEDIRSAVVRAFREHHLVVEGGGAVGLAALWSGYQPQGPAAVIVSGGNIDPAALTGLLEAAP